MNSGWNISATTGLANRTFSLLSDLTGVSRAWLIFLIDPKLDREPELRSSIFAIYVAALADAANEMESRIAGLVREAKRLGSKSCIYYLGAFSEYLAGTLDMLSVFERDDMIFITEIRNQRVHAHLDESHKASRRVRFMDGGRLRTVKIPSEEYWASFRHILGNPENIDSSIERLRQRFCEHKTLFWAIDLMLGSDQARELIRRDLHRHADFQGPDVQITFHEEGYKATKMANKALNLSLLDFRAQGRIAEQVRDDPVTVGCRTNGPL